MPDKKVIYGTKEMAFKALMFGIETNVQFVRTKDGWYNAVIDYNVLGEPFQYIFTTKSKFLYPAMHELSWSMREFRRTIDPEEI